MRLCTKLFAVGLSTAAIALAAPTTASAEQGGGDSVRCGSIDGNWNAPNGASVASRSGSGVVATILGYLGEHYSHIMISHGLTQMSHASMQTPRAYVYNSAGDHWVLEDIQRAGPGAATVNMGATYTYIHGQNEGMADEVDYVTGGTGGTTAANHLLSLPWCSAITDGNCRVTVDSGNMARDIIGFRVAGVTYRHSYGVYTFVEDFDVHNGNHMSSPHASLQCASFQAMNLNKSGVGTVQPHFYANSSVSNAVQGLYDIILDFASSAGANAGTSANLADQLANCFIDYSECENQSSTPWSNFKASGTANAISPDRIRGINAHVGVNTPWSGGATQAVAWNQPGSSYGCWTEDFRTWIEPGTTDSTGGTAPPPSCVPSCDGSACGQGDTCGGFCPTANSNSCGVCGNGPCGTCQGVNAVDISAAQDDAVYYTVTGTDVSATLSNLDADADLYIKLGSAPTTGNYDCRSWNSGTSNESCSVNGTGTFHIMIYGYRAFDGAVLVADVSTCDGDPPPTCTPSCTGDMCGQADGCGGTCASTDSGSCGMCGNAACGGGGTCDSVTYSAANTSNASYTDPDTVQYSVDLSAGTSYTFSTCAGSSSDTYLRLHNSSGTQVDANDDGCSSGYMSSFEYTPSSSGAYTLSLGCYSGNSCSGTVDISAAANSCTAM